MNCLEKTAIVAGGLGGIGYATCKSLLVKGVKNLGIWDIYENYELIASLKDDYHKVNIKFWKVDVRNRSDIDNAFRASIEQFGQIDILVTSVGVLDEMNPQRTVEINLLGTMQLNFAALEFMSQATGGKGGIVANVASLAGLIPFPQCAVYCATKFGIVGFTRCLGTDLYFKTAGIRFIAICPGFTTTPILENYKGSLINNAKEIQMGSVQPSEICGRLLVEAIENYKNGSIWKIADSKLLEIIQPDY